MSLNYERVQISLQNMQRVLDIAGVSVQQRWDADMQQVSKKLTSLDKSEKEDSYESQLEYIYAVQTAIQLQLEGVKHLLEKTGMTEISLLIQNVGELQKCLNNCQDKLRARESSPAFPHSEVVDSSMLKKSLFGAATVDLEADANLANDVTTFSSALDRIEAVQDVPILVEQNQIRRNVELGGLERHKHQQNYSQFQDNNKNLQSSTEEDKENENEMSKIVSLRASVAAPVFWSLSKQDKNAEKFQEDMLDLKPADVVEQEDYQTIKERNLKLKELKETILDISTKKVRQDMSDEKTCRPRKTMRQFLEHYMKREQKRETEQEFMNTLQQYKDLDSNIIVFHKVMVGEVDEEFWSAQQQFESQVVDVLHKIIKKKYPGQCERQHGQILLQILNGRMPRVLVNELIQKLYLRQKCYKRIMEFFTKDWITFVDLMKQLILYNLQRHKQMISPIIGAFNELNLLRGGVLDAEQFVKFCRLLNPEISSKEIQVLWCTMDPQQTKTVTFSTCVHILSKQLDKMKEQQLS